MHLLFSKILQKIGLKYNSEYPIYINRLEYNIESDYLYCEIEIDKNEDKEKLSEFINTDLLNFVKTVNIEFKEIDVKNDFFSKNRLIDLLKSKDLTEYSAFIDYDNIKFDAENYEVEIIFTLQQPMSKFINEKKDIYLQDIIKKLYGLDIYIKTKPAKLKENEDYLQNLKEYDNSLREKIVESVNNNTKPAKEETVKTGIKCGKDIAKTPVKIKEIIENEDDTCIQAEIIDVDVRSIKDGESFIISLDLRDDTGAIFAKKFLKKKEYEAFGDKLKSGVNLLLTGRLEFDRFTSGKSFSIKQMQEIEKPEKRKDLYEKKRVELHMYSQMSQLDGFIDLDKCCKQLNKWGYTALGLTDKSVVQGYPQLYDVCTKNSLKPLFGIEAKILEDDFRIITNPYNGMNLKEFVVFDIETTGLSNATEKITEIGAVKIVNNKIIAEFNQLINPEMPIPEKITELTSITNDMVKNMPTINEVLPKFLEFVGNCTLIAHNADFDMGFIKKNCLDLGLKPVRTYIDTLALARAIEPHLKNHKLDTLTKLYNVNLFNHHRACDDASATGQVFIKMIDALEKNGKKFDININSIESEWPVAKRESHTATIYAKNLVGLKNLYKLVTASNLKYYYREGGIPKSELNKRREGLLIGTGNENGELIKAILSFESDDKISEIISRYDFLEVQPPLYYDGVKSKSMSFNLKSAEDLTLTLYKLSKTNGKLLVADTYAKYFEKSDYIFRNIILEGQPRKIYGEKFPTLYFRTTDEMMNEFSFLDKEIAEEIVIDNTIQISEILEDIKPIPDGTFPPVIEGSDKELREMTYKKARSIYGDNLPEIVESRLERELSSIISNGYAVLYIIAQKLVKKSNEDGYLVGSRGSVGSSFVATMADITEVNPLIPHYICTNCKYSEFIHDSNIGSGVDLPDKICPVCGEPLKKEGHNIPFEVFLGFDGDKEPDIDLNFAGEYQPTVHKYTEELFGEGKVFRAGTIGTISDKTAYGYIKKYFEDKNQYVNNSEIKYLQRGILGVKRTSGQHPGGVMIVPRNKDIEDFCPVQHPADDVNSDIITTHFNYKSISGRILKLDLLGHDVPTIIKMLSDMTGIDPLTIPMDDKETMSIFSSIDALHFEETIDGLDIGTLGIPEFGTNFVRGMLRDTMPKTFSELVRISGLSHGTNVWLNNAQDLIRNGVVELKDTICTRDDIMIYLINKGLEKKKSFKIMETVRKNRLLDEETINYMKENNVPDWYIESCKTIEYLFPKAHAVAYVMMSYRIAYFKVHYPEAFYSTFFTIKLQDYPGDIIVKGLEAIRDEMKFLKDKYKELNSRMTAKDSNKYSVLEVAEEMYCRGIKQSRVDLKKSDKSKFKVLEKGYIQPPFNALEGVSDANAIAIFEEIKKGDFISKQDFTERTKVNKTALEILEEHGVLDGLQSENQISLFDF
ncbi:PolC-type DNA polymerase III [uncultured Finegoldia sp.]|uniref:PolC-type DNA polymerase III n=1 Tax=uncultured Finegoldia sp. TaxID=328009 RepID=UPI00261271FD|nr:PolC-type DNA polymerase III [uncultured Finegoldia sp.]